LDEALIRGLGLRGRIAWAGVAAIAGLTALGLATTAAAVALTQRLGLPAAFAILATSFAAVAALGIYLAWRAPYADSDDGARDLVAVRLARDLVRKQPLSAMALFGVVGYMAARRPEAAADIGRGVARLMSH
jgi:hypothetical protein